RLEWRVVSKGKKKKPVKESEMTEKEMKNQQPKKEEQLQREVARNNQRFEIKKRRSSLIAITERLIRHNMKRKLVQKRGRGIDLQEKREDRRLRDRTRQKEAEWGKENKSTQPLRKTESKIIEKSKN
ncbi:16839_t:CDS:1, partial [Dentiscutata heterogama]